jgi:hypothetical protein
MTDQDKLEAVVDFKEELITLKQYGTDPKDYSFSYGTELEDVFKVKCGVWRVIDEGKLSPLNNVKANTESLKDGRFLEVRTVKYRIVVKGQGPSYQVGSLWLRDLTRECVEANPGPMWKQARDWMLDKRIDKKDKWNDKFDKLAKELDKCLGDQDVELRHVHEYLDTGENQKAIKAILSDSELKNLKEWMADYDKEHAQDKTAPTTLAQIISSIKKDHPTTACVVDTPELVGVDLELQFEGRTKELDQLLSFEKANIDNFERQVKTKQFYSCPLVHGGLGFGKTRLIVEHNQALAVRNSNFSCASVLVDFSRGDDLDESETLMDIALGLRVAAHFLFGKDSNWLKPKIYEHHRHLFTFGEVLSYIGTQYAINKPLLLSLQIDEFGLIASESLNKILRLFSTHMSTRHNDRVCLLPYLSGTTTAVGLAAITLSQLQPQPILLPPLGEVSSEKILVTALQATNKAYLIGHKLLPIATASLGNNPRNFQLFVAKMGVQELSENVGSLLSEVLTKVVDAIRGYYGTAGWQDLIGNSQEGVTRMCVWALSGREVILSDLLNGVTVEDVRSTGIVQLLQGSVHNRFQLFLPQVVIRALNIDYAFVSPEMLDPLRRVDCLQFESEMAAIYILRNNMLVSLGQTTATYQELYPHAVGHPATLNRTVNIVKLTEVYANGSSAAHESIHHFPRNRIPIIHGISPTIDSTQPGVYIHNIPISPSVDGFVPHSPNNVQGAQYKSSDDIFRGLPPKTKVKLGTKAGKTKKTIWAEYKKVTNKAHKDFYFGKGNTGIFTLAFVTNKPVNEWDAIVADPVAAKLPVDVILVANQNFKKYSAMFCNAAIFLQPGNGEDEAEEDEMMEDEVEEDEVMEEDDG